MESPCELTVICWGAGAQVSLTWDFSACRVYWKATLSAGQDARAEAVLQRSAPQLR